MRARARARARVRVRSRVRVRVRVRVNPNLGVDDALARPVLEHARAPIALAAHRAAHLLTRGERVGHHHRVTAQPDAGERHQRVVRHPHRRRVRPRHHEDDLVVRGGEPQRCTREDARRLQVGRELLLGRRRQARCAVAQEQAEQQRVQQACRSAPRHRLQRRSASTARGGRGGGYFQRTNVTSADSSERAAAAAGSSSVGTAAWAQMRSVGSRTS